VKIVVTVAVIAAAIALGEGAARAGAEEGKAVYAKKCHVCHSLGGSGGKQAEKGGPLDGVGKKRDAAWLKAYFADPKSKIPDAKMPKLKLTDAEWEDVVQHMLTLQ